MGREWWRWWCRSCASGIRRGPEPADRPRLRLGPGARRSRSSTVNSRGASGGHDADPAAGPHLERSEARQLVAQHGMDLEAPATSPLQEMVWPAAKTQPTSGHRWSATLRARHSRESARTPRPASMTGSSLAPPAPSAVRLSPMLGVAPPPSSLPDSGTNGPDLPLSQGRALRA